MWPGHQLRQDAFKRHKKGTILNPHKSCFILVTAWLLTLLGDQRILFLNLVLNLWSQFFESVSAKLRCLTGWLIISFYRQDHFTRGEDFEVMTHLKLLLLHWVDWCSHGYSRLIPHIQSLSQDVQGKVAHQRKKSMTTQLTQAASPIPYPPKVWQFPPEQWMVGRWLSLLGPGLSLV